MKLATELAITCKVIILIDYLYQFAEISSDCQIIAGLLSSSLR